MGVCAWGGRVLLPGVAGGWGMEGGGKTRTPTPGQNKSREFSDFPRGRKIRGEIKRKNETPDDR